MLELKNPSNVTNSSKSWIIRKKTRTVRDIWDRMVKGSALNLIEWYDNKGRMLMIKYWNQILKSLIKRKYIVKSRAIEG